MTELETIEGKFKNIKRIGGDGESLLKLTSKTLENIQYIVSTFEAGMADPGWSDNFNSNLTQTEIDLVNSIYTEFKASLTNLGL